jgi:C-terminal processing protease CtpA/Prc
VTTTWRAESSAGRVRVERTYSFFPGDVNEPARESEQVSIYAKIENGPAIAVHATVGERAMSIDVEETADGDGNRIVEKLQFALGRC